MDPYSVLGVSRNANEGEIKKAYRRLANAYHPDRPTGDEEKFKELAEAYDILSDPQKRQAFDNPNPFRGFNPFGGFFKGGFDIHFGFGKDPRQPPQHGTIAGPEIRQSLRVSVFDILLNMEVALEYDRRVHCPDCQGRGSNLLQCRECHGLGFVSRTIEAGHQLVRQDGPCHTCQGRCYEKQDSCSVCGGDGLVVERTKEQLPLGRVNGGRIVVPNKGNHGPFQGPAGPLVLEIHMWYPAQELIPEEARELIRKATEIIQGEYNAKKV